MNNCQGLCPNPQKRKLLIHVCEDKIKKIKEKHQTWQRERDEQSYTLALYHAVNAYSQILN